MRDRDHEQAQAEAIWTRDQAIAWAESQYAKSKHWPTRRFRVQDSPAGNSRLQLQWEAIAAQKRYGGHVVEIVPSYEAYMAEFRGVRFDPSPMITVAVKLGPCPSCKTPAGAPCVRGGEGGKSDAIWPHTRRLKAAGYSSPEKYVVEAIARFYDACHRCSATAGQPCTKDYPLSFVHARATGARMYWWPCKNRRFLLAEANTLADAQIRSPA